MSTYAGNSFGNGIGGEEVAVGREEYFRLLYCSIRKAACNDPTSCSSEFVAQGQNEDSSMSIPS